MAEGKNSIIVYRDWINIFNDLSDEEAGKLIKHFFRYIHDQEPEAPDRLTSLLFNQIKSTLKRDLKKWESKSQKNRENALLRWNKENANASERIKRNANDADSDSDSDSDSDKDNKLIVFLCDKFSINEITNPDKWTAIIRIIHFFKGQDEKKNRYFRDSVYFYFKYKELEKEKKHGFNSFLGTYEKQYIDGGWNADNWIKKYKEITKYSKPGLDYHYDKKEQPIIKTNIG